MSNTYPMYFSSSFPDDIDQFDRFTDLNLDTLEYAKQYQAYIERNNFSGAAQILIDHPELKSSLINAENLNRIIDAIKCIETYYVEDVQKYLIEIIKFKSEYSSSVKYSKYDLIIYHDIAYLCISSNTPIGTLPTNANYFIALTWKGEKGEPGINLTFLGNWLATVTYQKDSCVTYNNVLYSSMINDNIGKTPSQNSSYWTVVFDVSKLYLYDNSSSNLSSTTLQNAVDELNIKINNNTNNINSNSNKITSNTNSINDINSRISNVNNTPDSQKSVNYSNASGTANYANSAGTASSCTGNSATSTNANYANSAGNSDTVDGFHFKLSSTDISAGSSLSTNMFCFVYE